MTIITYTMSDYDFLLGLARLCAGSAAGHISICRWINGDYGKDHYVFAGRLPPDLIHHIDTYICWYNERRLKVSLGSRSPIEYRHALGLMAA